MGRKVHPNGFRLGVIRDWQAKWYADKHYAEYLLEDLKLRRVIEDRYADAAVSLCEIERQANQIAITVHTARPGIVIGRGGQRVDESRRFLERLINKKIQLNIREIQQPELDAYLVARSVADQIERRIAYRRAMKQALMRTLQAGARGMKISCSGRLGGAEIARRLNMHEGQVPLHTLRADIDYGFAEARTVMGRIGVKVWIYKGEILPELKVEEEPVLSFASELETAPAAAPVAAEPEAAPKRSRARRTPAKAEAEAETGETTVETGVAEAPKRPRARRKTAEAETEETAVEAEAAAAPKRPRARRKTAEAESDAGAETAVTEEGNDNAATETS